MASSQSLNTSELLRPANFIVGEDYILIERQFCMNQSVQETVRFVGYAPCPATVVVRDGHNFKFYVSRDNLFLGKSRNA